MAAVDIFPVFPTPMSRQLMKSRLKSAEKGHTILKKKSDVLQLEMRKVSKEIMEIKGLMGQIMKEAAYLLAESRFFDNNLTNNVLHSVSRASIKTISRVENVAGVQLQVFECYKACSDQYDLAGLARGGEIISMAKKAYGEAAEILVQLATLQTSFILLDDIIISTNRRVNALEYRYIPKVLNTIRYIEDEIDERERQDFYRLKMVKKKKEKYKMEVKKREQALRDMEDQSSRDMEDQSSRDMKDTSSPEEEDTSSPDMEDEFPPDIETTSPPDKATNGT